MKAIGYVRVSTAEQGASGLGLAAQRSAIQAAADRMVLTLGAVFEDSGISGATTAEERIGLMSAIGVLKRGDVLLVAKRDRLGRDVVNVALVERLVERKGCRIVSAAGEGTESQDPTGMLMRRIVDAFAEYERLLIGARTKAALRAKRGRGQRAGAVPFGYSADASGSLVAVEDEQRALALMRTLRRAGKPLRAIAAEMEAAGFRTKGGGKWYSETVRSVLSHDRTTSAG